jgi:transcriptional regulator with XRE-family HTH domain
MLHAPNPMQPSPGHPPLGDEIARRIRARRISLGLSLAQLASASGLRSRSYVFHIENGTKAPSEDVAGRIAAALGDDPAVYRAWARARSRTDLASALEAARTLSGLLGGESTAAVAAQAPPATEPEPVPPAASAEPLVHVPVLAEGTDPGDGAGGAEALEVLALDPKVFPPGPRPVRPFAYRLTAHGARRLPELLQPGDCVVISRDGEPPVEDAAYAVRIGARIELARVHVQGDALVLPYGSHGHDSERVAAPVGKPVERLIAGKVVVAIRRWL